MPTLARKVWRDLTRRRARTALTLAGIVVGVTGLVAVSATARGLAEAQAALIAAPDQPDFAVRTAPVAPRVAAVLARHLGGATVVARPVAETTFSAGGPWRGVTLIGLPADGAPALARPEVVAGRLPGPGEVAFDRGVSALAEVGIGDVVSMREDAGAPSAELRVVGLTRTAAALDAGILNRVTAYAAEGEVEGLLGRPGANEVLVRLVDGTTTTTTTAPPRPPTLGGAKKAAARAEAAERIATFLDRRGVPHGAVEDPAEGLVGGRELRTLVWLLFAFSVLGLGLSGALVATTVAGVVADEAGQIGVLKALGAERRRVALTYVAPAVVLGLAGTVAGYGAGLAGGWATTGYLTGLLGYPRPAVAVTAREVGLAAAVGLGVPTAAAVGPALLAARRPVGALLRAYGLAGRVGRPTGAGRAVAGRWPLGVLAARNAVRRRLRGGMAVGLVATAVAAAVGAQGLAASLDGTVDELYDRYGADVWVPFAGPADAALAAAVGREPGVTAAEAWSRATGYARAEAIDLWGVPAGSTVYRRRMVAGRWYRADEGWAAVASGALARRLGLEVGERLALDIGAETREFAVVGIVDDESTYLGSTAAGKLFLAPEAAAVGREAPFTFLAVAFDRHDPAGVEARIAALEAAFAGLHPRPYAAYADQAATDRTTRVLTLLLRAMTALVGLTGLVGVANALALGVAERRREIGVARALGAGRRHVATLVVGEALVLGGAGFGLGLLAGVPLAAGLVRATGAFLFRLEFLLPVASVGVIAAATLAACALAALGPALAAARVRPHEVLRYE